MHLKNALPFWHMCVFHVYLITTWDTINMVYSLGLIALVLQAGRQIALGFIQCEFCPILPVLLVLLIPNRTVNYVVTYRNRIMAGSVTIALSPRLILQFIQVHALSLVLPARLCSCLHVLYYGLIVGDFVC